MKTCVVKFFAGSGIRLAILSLLFLAIAGVCIAQASAAAARPAVQTAVAPQAQPVAQPAQAAAPGKPAANGTHEGIKVHGHWTIEVRNPDGKLVTHREFENSLVVGGGDNGSVFLAGLLRGTTTLGAWEVTLADNPTNPTFVIFITQPNVTEGQASCYLINQNPPSITCSNNLALNGGAVVTPGSTQYSPVNNGPTFTMTGSGTVAQGVSSSVEWVSTINWPCVPSEATTACDNDPLATRMSLTAATLDGKGTDPSPVPVTGGQTVAVTVAISFQ